MVTLPVTAQGNGLLCIVGAMTFRAKDLDELAEDVRDTMRILRFRFEMSDQTFTYFDFTKPMPFQGRRG